MTGFRATAYHHGNLRNALIEQAWELVRATTPDQVTVREVARRVGVSHNAAYRHFADRHELMRALAERAMEALTEAMRERVEAVAGGAGDVDATRARFRETGRAYVLFAIAEPQLFDLAFHVEFAGPDVDPRVTERSDGPYGVLNDALDEMVEVGALTPGRRAGAEVSCWAAVHGFADLCVNGPLRRLPAPERDAALESLLRTVENGLTA